MPLESNPRSTLVIGDQTVHIIDFLLYDSYYKFSNSKRKHFKKKITAMWFCRGKNSASDRLLLTMIYQQLSRQEQKNYFRTFCIGAPKLKSGTVYKQKNLKSYEAG